MEKSEYRKHFDLEENHWWFRGRRKILLNLLRSRTNLDRTILWLDAGCGTGINLKLFELYGRVFGCDYSEDALSFCRKRGLRNLVRADVQKLPYKKGVFDAVSLLDVLYHKNISDDVGVLREVHRLLKTDGIVLIADSAFKILSSPHDQAVHARERYKKKTLKKKLEAAGFEPLRLGYFNFFLFPIIFMVRLKERFAAKIKDPHAPVQSDLKAVHPILNALLYTVLAFEAFLIKKISLPWGSSIICLAYPRQGSRNLSS
jgi:SAM-dependent methyltransferase